MARYIILPSQLPKNYKSTWRHKLSYQVDLTPKICRHGDMNYHAKSTSPKVYVVMVKKYLARWLHKNYVEIFFFWPLPRGYNFYTEQTLQFNRQASWRLRVRVWVIWYLYFSSTVIMQRKKWCQEELTRPHLRKLLSAIDLETWRDNLSCQVDLISIFLRLV